MTREREEARGKAGASELKRDGERVAEESGGSTYLSDRQDRSMPVLARHSSVYLGNVDVLYVSASHA